MSPCLNDPLFEALIWTLQGFTLTSLDFNGCKSTGGLGACTLGNIAASTPWLLLLRLVQAAAQLPCLQRSLATQ